jgi:hypothetical protein
VEKVNDEIAGLEHEEIHEKLADDRAPEESKKDLNTEDEDLYNIKNFTI